MIVAVTGAAGFIGQNLCVRLEELGSVQVLRIGRGVPEDDLARLLRSADVVVHLAGVNRPKDDDELVQGNVGFTESLCRALEGGARATPILYASSARASEDTAYGRSKLAAEHLIHAHGRRIGAQVAIFRLPNVFGKWCKPNYNSAVATFCNNVANGLPIFVHDASAPITVVYIDDVVNAFLGLLRTAAWTSGSFEVAPVYSTTVGFVADAIGKFASLRQDNIVADVGAGLLRALYATYVSYLPLASFTYPLVKKEDQRGAFIEFVKTNVSGQVSVFTTHPGITRGGHYHHTKTEKFLVIQGKALFRFRHILTDKVHEIRTYDHDPVVVESVPGWAHDVTNVGDGLMVCCLWSSEQFDAAHPDTIAHKV